MTALPCPMKGGDRLEKEGREEKGQVSPAGAADAAPVLAPTDPFLVRGPAIVSFSGGRTSALMLRRVLDAHGGALPPDVFAVFSNTGREMPATLDFVRECGARWGVDVVWLEYRRDPDTGRQWAERVTHETASRDGEPFAACIAARGFLPNPVARFCTTELKIRTLKRWVRDALGWDHWTNAVGLRADEPRRVKAAAKHESKERWARVHPLADAGITKLDVLRFWRAQPFDLRLAGPWEGNCDLCFLKGAGAISRVMADHPERSAWWIAQEAAKRGKTANAAAARFRADRDDYAALARATRDQGALPFGVLDQLMPCASGGCGV